MKRICILCCLVLGLSLLVGCKANTVQKLSEVIISGMTFTVEGETYDISKLESSANAIVQCNYITDTVFILECHISPKISFYALFNVATMDYTGSFYGTNCTWIDDDLSSIIYAYEDSVCDASGQTLYTFDKHQTQHIFSLEWSPNGKTVTVYVRDDNSPESDVKTYTFEK